MHRRRHGDLCALWARTMWVRAEQISRPDLIAAIKPLLEDSEQVICGQNLKYDINVLANYDIHMAGTDH